MLLLMALDRRGCLLLLVEVLVAGWLACTHTRTATVVELVEVVLLAAWSPHRPRRVQQSTDTSCKGKLS